MNDRIRSQTVRLIDENETQVGVVEIQDALQRARDAGLDLVEVARDSHPPVCRILDYGKWKYEQSKKDKANKAKSKTAELKEVRLGRSMKIDPHDIQIRLNQARRFLMDGHKVQIVQNFRGREMMHKDRGYDRMRMIVDQMEDIAKLETPPRMAGRRMTMILAPDKPKIEHLRRKSAAEQKAGAKTDEPAAPDVAAPEATSEPAAPTVETSSPGADEPVEARQEA